MVRAWPHPPHPSSLPFSQIDTPGEPSLVAGIPVFEVPWPSSWLSRRCPRWWYRRPRLQPGRPCSTSGRGSGTSPVQPYPWTQNYETFKKKKKTVTLRHPLQKIIGGLFFLSFLTCFTLILTSSSLSSAKHDLARDKLFAFILIYTSVTFELSKNNWNINQPIFFLSLFPWITFGSGSILITTQDMIIEWL